MSLYGRLAGTGSPDQTDRIAIHAFCAGVAKYFRGKVTLANVVSAFNLSASEQTELAAIKSAYDAKAATAKVDYLMEVQDTFILSASFPTLYTEAKAKSDLGF